jgi:hypothetical protein
MLERVWRLSWLYSTPPVQTSKRPDQVRIIKCTIGRVVARGGNVEKVYSGSTDNSTSTTATIVFAERMRISPASDLDLSVSLEHGGWGRRKGRKDTLDIDDCIVVGSVTGRNILVIAHDGGKYSEL